MLGHSTIELFGHHDHDKDKDECTISSPCKPCRMPFWQQQTLKMSRASVTKSFSCASRPGTHRGTSANQRMRCGTWRLWGRAVRSGVLIPLRLRAMLWDRPSPPKRPLLCSAASCGQNRRSTCHPVRNRAPDAADAGGMIWRHRDEQGGA